MLPFISDRLSVPERVADFPLLNWIPRPWWKIMEKPHELLRNPTPEGKYPRMYLRVKRGEWEKYLSRLASATMLFGFQVHEIPKGPKGEDLSSGVFPVPKDRKRGGTLVDRRRQNWAEVPWESVPLPHAVTFARHILKPGRRLRIFISGLPDY